MDFHGKQNLRTFRISVKTPVDFHASLFGLSEASTKQRPWSLEVGAFSQWSGWPQKSTQLAIYHWGPPVERFFFCVVYFSRGTLPTKKETGERSGTNCWGTAFWSTQKGLGFRNSGSAALRNRAPPFRASFPVGFQIAFGKHVQARHVHSCRQRHELNTAKAYMASCSFTRMPRVQLSMNFHI